jgi:hypothetical protein
MFIFEPSVSATIVPISNISQVIGQFSVSEFMITLSEILNLDPSSLNGNNKSLTVSVVNTFAHEGGEGGVGASS